MKVFERGAVAREVVNVLDELDAKGLLVLCNEAEIAEYKAIRARYEAEKEAGE